VNLDRFRVLPWLMVVILSLISTASAEWKEKVLYSFQGIPDGSGPVGAVVFDQAGNLYGATTEGGSSSCHSVTQCGTVFQLAPPAQQGDPWTETVLYVFKGNASNDGATPVGGLVIDSSGNLYGTTGYGGTGDCILVGLRLGCGTVYELSPPAQKGGAWTETILYSFPTAKQGYLPNGDLVFDSAGNLYGATMFGGGFGTTCDPFYQYCGSVFKLSPPKTKGGKWTEKVLHGFAGGMDGLAPTGGLILDDKGAVYGTTSGGGGPGWGTAFELKQPTKKGGAWTEKILHLFANGTDGASPNGGLIFDTKGALYGTTLSGGLGVEGTVFRLTKTSGGRWAETILYSFSYLNTDDGTFPVGGLALDKSGDLYGTAGAGGTYNGGVAYRLKPAGPGKTWPLTVLYDFERTPDGSGPEARLINDGAGSLYSTTSGGGTPGNGTVFKVAP
jgi:uncharacterized repeat protein (TIGR03803 family)